MELKLINIDNIIHAFHVILFRLFKSYTKIKETRIYSKQHRRFIDMANALPKVNIVNVRYYLYDEQSKQFIMLANSLIKLKPYLKLQQNKDFIVILGLPESIYISFDRSYQVNEKQIIRLQYFLIKDDIDTLGKLLNEYTSRRKLIRI